MNKKQFILLLKKKDYEKKIEKLSLNMNNENKKFINKLINKLNNELDSINYKLEKIRGIK